MNFLLLSTLGTYVLIRGTFLLKHALLFGEPLPYPTKICVPVACCILLLKPAWTNGWGCCNKGEIPPNVVLNSKLENIDCPSLPFHLSKRFKKNCTSYDTRTTVLGAKSKWLDFCNVCYGRKIFHEIWIWNKFGRNIRILQCRPGL